MVVNIIYINDARSSKYQIMYLLIKYIKSVLWRVAKCLSYTEEARCLKVNASHFKTHCKKSHSCSRPQHYLCSERRQIFTSILFQYTYLASFILYDDQQTHTIISQIIILLHVSTLSCHPQTVCNQYLAQLHRYFKYSCR